MTEYLQLIGLTLIGGVMSLIGGVILLNSQKTAEGLARYATPFAAGALLSAVFLDLLKDGLEISSADVVLLSVLIGFLIFFMGERMLHWFHHHHGHEDEKHGAEKPLIIIGDTIHNALDGVAIAVAFMVSPATGLVTTIAVAAHEIPQEIGDFGLLLSRGMSRRKVLIVNLLNALSATASAVLVFALGSTDVLPLGVVLGVSAGFLLYIATSDIIPEIHANTAKHKLFDWPVVMLLAGVIVVGLAINMAHKYIHTDANRDHSHDSSQVIEEFDDHDY
ncbi:ZIP family metal transporter [Candidatus Saccharibacteria bacterium]|nr:ZIP family metal transporter [Candidatus Saccharibacteria bacterium]